MARKVTSFWQDGFFPDASTQPSGEGVSVPATPSLSVTRLSGNSFRASVSGESGASHYVILSLNGAWSSAIATDGEGGATIEDLAEGAYGVLAFSRKNSIPSLPSNLITFQSTANSSNRIRIQNRLMAEALIGPFYKVGYTGRTASIDPSTAIPPSAVLVNEVRTGYIPDNRYGISIRKMKQPWTFQLLIEFPCEVCLEHFEEKMVKIPIKIEKDIDSGLSGAILELSRGLPEHPPRKSTKGTKVAYEFNVNTLRQ